MSLVTATVAKGPLQAELYWTIIDAFNHVVLYTANKISFKSFFGIKKVLVFIPAIFFALSGLITFNHVYESLVTGEISPELPAFSFIPIFVI